LTDAPLNDQAIRRKSADAVIAAESSKQALVTWPISQTRRREQCGKIGFFLLYGVALPMLSILIGMVILDSEFRSGAYDIQKFPFLKFAPGRVVERLSKDAEVFATIRRDITEILYKDPHWEHFEESCVAKSPSSQHLRGLASNKELLRLLHRLHYRYVVNPHVEVTPQFPFVLSSTFGARFAGQLATGGLVQRMLHWLPWGKSRLLRFELDVNFHVSRHRKVDIVHFARISVASKECNHWIDALQLLPARILCDLAHFSQSVQYPCIV
jgi:hypothetical protein